MRTIASSPFAAFMISPASTGGSFVYELLAPSAEHPTDFCERFREVCELLRIKRLHVPCELEEQFQEVSSCDASINKHYFFRMRAVAREEAILNRVKEHFVYFGPECEAVRFREVG